MILFNATDQRRTFNSTANNGNVVTYNERLVTLGYATHDPATDFYTLANPFTSKRAGDVVTLADFASQESLGDKLIAATGGSEGVFAFNVAMGIDFHSRQVFVLNEPVPDMDPATGIQRTDPTTGAPLTTIQSTFYKADQLGGMTMVGDVADFDAGVEKFHYLNSTTDTGAGTGTRTLNAQDAHSIGTRQQGTFYQLQRP